MKKVLNFGSLNLDYIYSVDHFIAPGETAAAVGFEVTCGGKGLNQSIALARAGLQVFHAGMVGASDGEMLVEALRASGVDTTYVFKTPEYPSGHAIIQVNTEGENCILLYGGGNAAITRSRVDEVLAHFAAGDYLFLQNEIVENDYIIRQAKERGMIVVLNPSPMDKRILSLPLELVDYFILNEVEAEQIVGEKSSDYLTVLKGKFADAKMVLTLGSNGSMYWDGSDVYEQSIFPTSVVDTTAAGDTFTGYFFGSLMHGKDAQSALKIASKASSMAVAKMGASVSIPLLDEVLESLNL